MRFSRLALVLLGKTLLASGQDLPDIPSIAPRQFQSITLTTSGQKPPTTSTSTSASSTSTTSLTLSTTTRSVSSASSSTGYNLVVTEIFTPPTGCDGRFTAVLNRHGRALTEYHDARTECDRDVLLSAPVLRQRLSHCFAAPVSAVGLSLQLADY